MSQTASASLTEARAGALLGDTPRVTMVDPNDPDTCLSVRLEKHGASWLGLVDDRAALLDRVRMGLKPRFVLHPDASTSTVSGELDVKVLGRAEAVRDPRAARLLLDQPFPVATAVLIEAVPRGLALEPLEPGGPVMGAVPRT